MDERRADAAALLRAKLNIVAMAEMGSQLSEEESLSNDTSGVIRGVMGIRSVDEMFFFM